MIDDGVVLTNDSGELAGGDFHIYILAVKFALGQLSTLGSFVGEYPRSVTELCFTVGADITGSLMFIKFTAQFTEMLVKLGGRNSESRGKVKVVLRYLRSRGIQKELYHRVKRYLQYTFSDTSRQLDTSIMSHISESLKGELKCVTIGAHLQHFELFAHTSSKTLAKLAALCEELIFTVHEMIEAAGQTASGLSIVIQGHVKIADHNNYV